MGPAISLLNGPRSRRGSWPSTHSELQGRGSGWAEGWRWGGQRKVRGLPQVGLTKSIKVVSPGGHAAAKALALVMAEERGPGLVRGCTWAVSSPRGRGSA